MKHFGDSLCARSQLPHYVIHILGPPHASLYRSIVVVLYNLRVYIDQADSVGVYVKVSIHINCLVMCMLRMQTNITNNQQCKKLK